MLVDQLFYLSVQALYFAAHSMGISYELINVLIFLILWPTLTFGLCLLCLLLLLRIKRLETAFSSLVQTVEK